MKSFNLFSGLKMTLGFGAKKTIVACMGKTLRTLYATATDLLFATEVVRGGARQLRIRERSYWMTPPYLRDVGRRGWACGLSCKVQRVRPTLRDPFIILTAPGY
jgi:hypothetical protein